MQAAPQSTPTNLMQLADQTAPPQPEEPFVGRAHQSSEHGLGQADLELAATQEQRRREAAEATAKVAMAKQETIEVELAAVRSAVAALSG